MDEESWKTWKSKQNVVMDEELVQNFVMDEELVQNVVMDGKFAKNFVVGAKIDPKVVMDLSIFKIGGWNTQQPSDRNLLACGNPKVKESKWQNRLLTLLCEGLCELLVTLQQQHFAASNDLHEHLRRHSLWKDSMKMESSKMRSESSECTWSAKSFLIHLESYLEECAQEVWERNRMSPDMHTTWWNVKILKPMEMILMVLRERSEENDPLGRLSI